MDRKLLSPVLVTLAAIILIVIAFIAVQSLSTLQSDPTSQFSLARRRWETNLISHYRMAGNYTGNFSQCYYDIEVQQDRIVDIFTMSCLSSAESKTLTVDGIFKNFERLATGRVCSPNGCYCEGVFVVSATYEQTLGYPQSITTYFHRRWLDDLLHSKFGVQQCLRIDPVVEKFEVVKLTILP
jgi:hypothetical protein